MPQNSVGRCIYCDSIDSLTREHVIPRGIGGGLVLGAASCEACRKITAGIEGRVLGQMMGHYRAKAGLTRKDRRKDIRPVKITDGEGVTTRREMEVDKIPSAVAFPVFAEPGIISGAAIGGPYVIRIFTSLDPTGLGRITFGPPDQPGESMAVAGLAPDVYGQMLAKIALGFAVSELGIDGFKPLVRAFILGQTSEFGHWIGGPANHPQEPPSAHEHELTLAFFETPHRPTYVAVYVRLFAKLGGPRNYVIVGEALPEPS